MDQKVVVNHWRYEDGWSDIPYVLLKDKNSLTREFREEVVGWHCWVYCNDHHEFIAWMEEHCPGADCTPRFNSGDPMITVSIKDKDEAAYFMLNFGCIMLNYNLYLGDRNETELYDWLCENIGPLGRTAKAEWNYFTQYHGDNDLWIMHSADVSDTSSQYDIITVMSFKHREDAVMAKLRFGGSM